MSINIEVEGGKSVRLKTAGKYCDRDIVVTAKGGASGENKLAKVVDRSITELTANDLYGVTTIGIYAFGYCSKLKSVEFPETLVSIGNNAFTSCSALRYIEFPTSLSSLGNDAFSGCAAIASEVVINGNVKIVGNNAFYNCQKLPSIVLHEGIEKIGSSAFQMCYALKEVYIPNSVTEIGMQAFRSCKAIEKVTIGKGVTKINANAFTDNTELKSVTIKATTPPSIQSTTFQNVPADCPFYVPPASVEAYKAATNWSARADYIFPILDGAQKGDLIYTTVISNDGTGIPWDSSKFQFGKIYFVEDTAFNVYSEYSSPYPVLGTKFVASDGREYEIFDVGYGDGNGYGTISVKAVDGSVVTPNLAINFYSAQE